MVIHSKSFKIVRDENMSYNLIWKNHRHCLTDIFQIFTDFMQLLDEIEVFLIFIRIEN